MGTTGTIGVGDGPFLDVTAGDITLTLPAVAAAATGQVFHFKDSDGNATVNNITIEGDGAETIDDAANAVINTDYGKLSIVNLGDKWVSF